MTYTLSIMSHGLGIRDDAWCHSIVELSSPSAATLTFHRDGPGRYRISGRRIVFSSVRLGR